MFIAKTPVFLQFLMPSFTWKVRTGHKKLFLTFDDGPIPEVTPWVLDTLAEYDAKATFFCVGDNVRKHPEVFSRVLQEGHAVGNHTYNHLNGWKTTTREYLDNVAQCDGLVETRLFRPPYGKLSWVQMKALKKTHQIVMWDVLSGDFSPRLSPEQCFQFVKNHAGPGSVVVMHDSLKAERILRQLLPQTLAFFAAQGYQFESLNVPAEPRSAHVAAEPRSACSTGLRFGCKRFRRVFSLAALTRAKRVSAIRFQPPNGFRQST